MTKPLVLVGLYLFASFMTAFSFSISVVGDCSQVARELYGKEIESESKARLVYGVLAHFSVFIVVNLLMAVLLARFLASAPTKGRG